MSELNETVVLDDAGRALVFDRETGSVSRHTVPTALENVRLGGGRYVHGLGEGETVKAAAPAPVADEPVIPLSEEDVLPLPVEDQPKTAPIYNPNKGPEGEARAAEVAAALAKLDEFDYVKVGPRAGRPKCSALENLLGYVVTAAEVDAAWDAKNTA